MIKNFKVKVFIIVCALCMFIRVPKLQAKENALQFESFDLVAEMVKSNFTNKEYYPLINDVTVLLAPEHNEIIIVAEVNAAIKPNIAVEYADSLIRQTAVSAQFYGGAKLNGEKVQLKGCGKDYYGELWDYYNCNIMIYPHKAGADFNTNYNNAYIKAYILKGMHTKQAPKLDKKYQ